MSGSIDIDAVLDAIAVLRDEALWQQRVAEDRVERFTRLEDYGRMSVASSDANRHMEKASAFSRALRAAQAVADRGNAGAKGGNERPVNTPIRDDIQCREVGAATSD